MATWVGKLWVFGVSVGFDPGRHWVFLVEGIQHERRFEGRVVGWRAIESELMPRIWASAMAVIANSVSVQTNDLNHGPIQCLIDERS